jgi:hypothetical protein
MFYNYCPMNNKDACEGKDFEAGSSGQDKSFKNIAALTEDGKKPKNDACTYAIEAPKDVY